MDIFPGSAISRSNEQMYTSFTREMEHSSSNPFESPSCKP
jgi:hypothetical protein